MVGQNNDVFKIAIKHLEERNVFNQLDFDNIRLLKTSPKGNYKERKIVQSAEYKAIKKIFKNIYADIVIENRKSTLWDDLYAFPIIDNCVDSDDGLLVDKSVITSINCNLKTTELFVKETLQVAKDNFRTRFNKKTSNDSSRFFIIGDVGTGKTTFLKYVYSHFYEKIHKNENIFWLNIDLNKEYLNRQSVPDAIKLEAARHFRSSMYNELSEAMKEDLKSKIEVNFTLSENRAEFEAAYLDYITVFERERTKPYNSILQNTIIKYIEEKYGTVYILDGLDRLSETDGFLEKLNDVKDIISDVNRNGVFFFVMRKESHLSFLKTYVDLSNSKELTRLSNTLKRLEIKPAQLTDIIFNRFNVLLKKWDEIVYNSRSSILNSDEETEEDIEFQAKELIAKLKKEGLKNKDSVEAYFGIFMIFLLRGIRPEEDIDYDKWTIIESIRALKDLIGTNFRKLMDAINTVHEAFIESLHYAEVDIDKIVYLYTIVVMEKSLFFERQSTNLQLFNTIMKRDYRVIPSLLEGNSLYNHPYSYKINIISKNLDIVEKNMYSKFIYNIFYAVNTINQSCHYNLLIKIRILQFLTLNSEIDCTFDVIVASLNETFSYSFHDIKLAINELDKSELIAIDIIPNGYTFRVNRTGKNHITNLIYDFGYLRIILDDILIPEGYESYFTDPTPDLFKNNKPKWIINQVPRVALFISLISSVETVELSKMNENESKNWEIVPKIIESTTNIVYKICYVPDPKYAILKYAFSKSLSEIIYHENN